MVASRGALFERSEYNGGERVGDVSLGRYLSRIGRWHREVHHHDLRRALGFEGKSTREQLKQHDANRVQVTAPIDWVTLTLFRRHVVRRAADDAGARDIVWRDVVGFELREPKVEDFDVIAPTSQGVDHHVLRFQIPMNDTKIVRVGKCGKHLGEDAHDARDRQEAILGNDARQVPASQVLHDQVGLALGGTPKIVNRDGVRVVELA